MTFLLECVLILVTQYPVIICMYSRYPDVTHSEHTVMHEVIGIHSTLSSRRVLGPGSD